MSSSHFIFDKVIIILLILFQDIIINTNYYYLFISEAWSSISHFDDVRKLIANIKKSMLHSKARRSRYMTYLHRHGIAEEFLEEQSNIPKLTLRFMPLPNATRWNSWFKMAFYVSDYLDYIRGFYHEEQELETSEAIDNIMSIFSNNNTNGLVELYLIFIRYHAPQFISHIEFFQKECDPVFPFIEGRIQQLENFLNNGRTATNFGHEIDTALTKLNSDFSLFQPIFQSTFQAAYTKFTIHFSNHPSRSLFKATRIFDPRFLKLSLTNCDIQQYGFDILQLSNPSVVLLQEWSLYCNLDLLEVDYTNLGVFWEKMSLTFPLLTTIALDYIWLPISSCSVERSFSIYNNLLHDNRQNLSTESLKMLNMMYFNASN